MKEQLAILSLLIGSTCAGLARVAPPAEIGTSTQFRNEDGWGNYNFGYDEDHTSGGSFRRETGTALGAKTGSYGLRDADGRVRVVSYVADELGFRASISTNEPGTAPSTPADVTIGAMEQGPVAPAVPVASPAPAGYGAPARVAFNAAPAARPAYSSPAPIAPLSYGAPSPFAFKSAPVGPPSYAAPSPFAAKAGPVGPASYGGLAPAPFRSSPAGPASYGNLAPAPFGASPAGPASYGNLAPAPFGASPARPAPYGNLAPAPFGASPVAPAAHGPPAPATYKAAPFAPTGYGPSAPAASPFGAPVRPLSGAGAVATPVGHHYVYRQDNFVTIPDAGRPYAAQPSPHAYPGAYSSPHAGPAAHVTTSHAYGHKIAHPLGGGYHSYMTW
ncbi:uncharacterized protein LOC119462148 [Dermacentor silvarum]|uniref:uncharacterized protein LOC119462148 n=1 Tax=Dermacentor silvarum TaxID=543639 RepID=UPI001896CB7A|nr:uncharacterized protein LOC119462148 [Dermacentor silvarum]